MRLGFVICWIVHIGGLLTWGYCDVRQILHPQKYPRLGPKGRLYRDRMAYRFDNNILLINRIATRLNEKKIIYISKLQICIWRRGRDSNPRSEQTDNGFQDRRIRPLCHLSVYGIVRWTLGRRKADREVPSTIVTIV